MSASCKPGKIVCGHMHLLHERGLGVEKPVRFQHPMYLGCDNGRVQDVLQHGLDNDPIEALAGERQVVTIRQQLDVGRVVDIGANHLHVGVVIQDVCSGAARAAADDKHARPR
jgi:hypothetical protein